MCSTIQRHPSFSVPHRPRQGGAGSAAYAPYTVGRWGSTFTGPAPPWEWVGPGQNQREYPAAWGAKYDSTMYTSRTTAQWSSPQYPVTAHCCRQQAHECQSTFENNRIIRQNVASPANTNEEDSNRMSSYAVAGNGLAYMQMEVERRHS